MPTSHPYQINEIVGLIIYTNPKSILDIGTGFGKYGFLSREYLELYDGRENCHDWKRQIDGIEAFQEYINPIHEKIYNHIFIGNAFDVLPTLDTKYDLILLIDVLEHFDYKDGIRLLEICQKIGRNLIISTPLNIGHQICSFGNAFETHKFQWKKNHFKKNKNKFFVPNDESLIVYIGLDASKVKSRIKKQFLFVWSSQIKNFLHYLLR
jgi:hypothetical protein